MRGLSASQYHRCVSLGQGMEGAEEKEGGGLGVSGIRNHGPDKKHRSTLYALPDALDDFLARVAIDSIYRPQGLKEKSRIGVQAVALRVFVTASCQKANTDLV